MEREEQRSRGERYVFISCSSKIEKWIELRFLENIPHGPLLFRLQIDPLRLHSRIHDGILFDRKGRTLYNL